MFGMSFVYVVFEDGTDLYWARSRVLEYLVQGAGTSCPPGVTPQIGPGRDRASAGSSSTRSSTRDAASDSTCRSCAASRTGTCATALSARAGRRRGRERRRLREGSTRSRSIPVKLQAFATSRSAQIAAAVRGANGEVGGRVLEMAQHEYAIRGRGYVTEQGGPRAGRRRDRRARHARSASATSPTSQIGGNIRRGLAELDGHGEVVGRHRRHALRRERARRDRPRQGASSRSCKPSFPPGVELVTDLRPQRR